jgi:hypothetical protein
MWAAILALVLVLASAPAAVACTLTKVATPKEAELRVYFTRFPKEDATGGKYKKCKIVKSGGTTFFVTPFRQDANLVVHEDNWPKG